ncbi:protein DEFECTIVE IN EXINE FORMATION 1-like [Octopus sinensis]|nr:protein DEFECTIVE IN EXINE FORMATION 1-like [Octopus sinensis]
MAVAISRPFIYVWLSAIIFVLDRVLLAVSYDSVNSMKPDCGYDIQKIWMREVANTPFAAPPLIADVNGDGKLNIVAAPFSESITVLDAQTGQHMPDSLWPVQNLHSSIYASPLQYDADGDGMLDLLFCTSSGELFFYTSNGTRMKKYHQLPSSYVLKTWYQKVVIASTDNIANYVKAEVSSGVKSAYVPVSPHVLATPIIADLNRDGRREEIVIPVSYFYDEDEYRASEHFNIEKKNISITELEKYLVGGIVYLNLTSMQIMNTIFLELSQLTANFPAYILFSPTVIDLDSNDSHLETVTGTSSGKLYVIEANGIIRTGFPIPFDTLHGQLTIGDVNSDGMLEIIAIDTGGNIACLDRLGKTLWESEISGNSSPGTRLADINGDDHVEILVTTDVGDIYVLHGNNGSVFSGYPLHLNSPIHANILLSLIHDDTKALFFTLTEDGNMYILGPDTECSSHFNIGETSLVQTLSHDLVPQTNNMELLAATRDGTLICLSLSQNFMDDNEDYAMDIAKLTVLPSETKTPNDFTYLLHKPSIEVNSHTKEMKDVMGSSFNLEFQIVDPIIYDKTKKYTVHVYYGNNLLATSVYNITGYHSLTVPVWLEPSQGHIVVSMTNHHGQIFEDCFPVRFNKLILHDLQWLLISPFVAMATVLLVIHGFPVKDLLPLTNKDKNR